jgi:hypothetical protein
LRFGGERETENLRRPWTRTEPLSCLWSVLAAGERFMAVILLVAVLHLVGRKSETSEERS